jgi:hypothetical protein
MEVHDEEEAVPKEVEIAYYRREAIVAWEQEVGVTSSNKHGFRMKRCQRGRNRLKSKEEIVEFLEMNSFSNMMGRLDETALEHRDNFNDYRL